MEGAAGGWRAWAGSWGSFEHELIVFFLRRPPPLSPTPVATPDGALSPEGMVDVATAEHGCVALDDEDGESWNNLASVYMRMGEAGVAVTLDEKEDGDGDGDEDNEDGEAQVCGRRVPDPLLSLPIPFPPLLASLLCSSLLFPAPLRAHS